MFKEWSIDKVLDYIEQDIENPEKEESLGDLIDVHTLLTALKVKHIENTKDTETTSEDLYILSYSVVSVVEPVAQLTVQERYVVSSCTKAVLDGFDGKSEL